MEIHFITITKIHDGLLFTDVVFCNIQAGYLVTTGSVRELRTGDFNEYNKWITGCS